MRGQGQPSGAQVCSDAPVAWYTHADITGTYTRRLLLTRWRRNTRWRMYSSLATADYTWARDYKGELPSWHMSRSPSTWREQQ